jgi:hypothetical protein
VRGEDKCQVKVGHAPQNPAALRNAAIALVREFGGAKEIAPKLRHFASHARKLLVLGIVKQ